MIQALGDFSSLHQELVETVFLEFDFDIEFVNIERVTDVLAISFDENVL